MDCLESDISKLSELIVKCEECPALSTQHSYANATSVGCVAASPKFSNMSNEDILNLLLNSTGTAIKTITL